MPVSLHRAPPGLVRRAPLTGAGKPMLPTAMPSRELILAYGTGILDWQGKRKVVRSVAQRQAPKRGELVRQAAQAHGRAALAATRRDSATVGALLTLRKRIQTHANGRSTTSHEFHTEIRTAFQSYLVEAS